MLSSALVATGHGYEKSDRGRCEAFDPFEILANPLGEFSAADRERRIFRPEGDKPGSGVCYGSHALYLMRRKDEPTRGRDETGPLFVAVHHGGGRQVWRLPTCYHDRGETLAALLAMPERAHYSLLHGIVDALDDTKRAAERDTAHEWRQAAADKRIRQRSYPARGVRKVWIEPSRREGESEESFALRKRFAAP